MCVCARALSLTHTDTNTHSNVYKDPCDRKDHCGHTHIHTEADIYLCKMYIYISMRVEGVVKEPSVAKRFGCRVGGLGFRV